MYVYIRITKLISCKSYKNKLKLESVCFPNHRHELHHYWQLKF